MQHIKDLSFKCSLDSPMRVFIPYSLFKSSCNAIFNVVRDMRQDIVTDFDYGCVVIWRKFCLFLVEKASLQKPDVIW